MLGLSMGNLHGCKARYPLDWLRQKEINLEPNGLQLRKEWFAFSCPFKTIQTGYSSEKGRHITHAMVKGPVDFLGLGMVILVVSKNTTTTPAKKSRTKSATRSSDHG